VTAVQPFEAAVFDMDGLLTASESRWRIAEREMATLLGLDDGRPDARRGGAVVRMGAMGWPQRR
jgi:beta-phosphoglucomutase-like phosphatase (HAD superfamily)